MQQPNKTDPLQPNRVFVGGISWKADETSLANFFSSYGKVVECKIIMDKVTGKSKGYGFVTFETAESASKVKTSQNLYFLGKMMNVGDAVRKQEPKHPYAPFQPAFQQVPFDPNFPFYNQGFIPQQQFINPNYIPYQLYAPGYQQQFQEPIAWQPIHPGQYPNLPHQENPQSPTQQQDTATSAVAAVNPQEGALYSQNQPNQSHK